MNFYLALLKDANGSVFHKSAINYNSRSSLIAMHNETIKMSTKRKTNLLDFYFLSEILQKYSKCPQQDSMVIKLHDILKENFMYSICPRFELGFGQKRDRTTKLNKKKSKLTSQ